jgi:hypothetical protein
MSEIHTTFLSAIFKGSDFLKDLGADGRIILRYVLNKFVGGCGGLF